MNLRKLIDNNTFRRFCRFIVPIWFIPLFGGSAFLHSNSTSDTIELIDNMCSISRNINALEMEMILNERIGGEYHKSKSLFKIAYSPFRIYLKQEYPTEGLEMLYVEGKNNNKAKIQPGTFPWVSLNLSPLSNLVRQDFHHSIYKSGYSFIIEVLEHLRVKYQAEYGNLLKDEGLVKYDGNICHKIVYTNPYFKLTQYEVNEGETLEDISKKLKVSDYMIKELNPHIIHSFTKIEAGSRLQVPNDYAKTFVLYINKENSLLMGIKIFDNQGLWEEYSYRNVKLNPIFTPETFSPENEAYNF